MFFKNLILNKYFAVLIAIIIGIVSAYMLGNDNFIEQISEKVIKIETGIDLDLSPDTPDSHIEKTYFGNNSLEFGT